MHTPREKFSLLALAKFKQKHTNMNYAVIILSAISIVNCIYKDASYPYGMGPLEVKTRVYNPDIVIQDPPPMHSKVFYPDEANDYAVYYFVTGFGGLTPPALYDNISTQIASHGYVVYNSWAAYGDEGASIEIAAHVENLAWLEDNAPEDLEGAMPMFEATAFGCHSAGCGINLKLANNQSDMASGLVNLEPNNWSIYDHAPDYYLPSFNLGANLSLWECTEPGLNFEAWHEQLDCPKILVESANQGHCDFVDDEFWAGCSSSCAGGTEESVPFYRETVAGMVTAFMNTYSQGSDDYLQYIADPDEIPIPLIQHDADTDC